LSDDCDKRREYEGVPGCYNFVRQI
jgi:hypothetical protein